MHIKHIGLTCSSEQNSDLFYQGVLGLNKAEAKNVPSELMYQIFGIDQFCRIVNYIGDGLHFELFIDEKLARENHPIAHTCLEVADRDAFLEKCRRFGVTVNEIPKGDSKLIFVADPDGNLFEIKG